MFEQLERIFDGNCLLGESPIWDEREAKPYFVDIDRKCIHAMDGIGGRTAQIELPQKVSCIALCENDSLVMGMEDGVYLRSKAGELTLAHERIPIQGGRFNDGKVGPDGMYYVGTTDDRDRGAFYRVSGGAISVLFRPCKCSNGLDWSDDGKTMYYCDSRLHKVECFDFCAETHSLSNRRTLANIDPALGLPDGMTIDAQNNLWVAVWGGHCVLHLDGKTGELRGKIELPASQVTSCCFAGENLDKLMITTASVGMDLHAEPEAGNTFVIAAEVPGRPFYRYRFVNGV